MTKNELKAALDLAGVSLHGLGRKPNLAALQELYDAHIGSAPAAPAPAAPAMHPDQSETDMLADVQACAEQDALDSAVAQHEAVVAATPEQPTGTGLKIEKDRPEQNGIKRPSAGGKCRAIWDALDAYRTETGELPTSKTVKELAADSDWNPNNASIEFYQWRKFNGISKAK